MLDRPNSSFITNATAVALAGLVALSSISAKAQDAPPVVAADCGTMSAEICELDNMADAARKFATENQSVAILFHIGDDVRARDDGEEMMRKADVYFRRQFAEHGIEIETFARTNLNADATGLSYYYGHLVYQDGEGSINLNLKEGIEAIPKVALALSVLRQMTEGDRNDPPPNTGG